MVPNDPSRPAIATSGMLGASAAVAEVKVVSGDGSFKSDQDTFNAAGPDATLDFNGCDRLELPALGSLLIEHILKLLAGHLAAKHAFAELDHRVLVSIRHAKTIRGARIDVVPTICDPHLLPPANGADELLIASRVRGVHGNTYERGSDQACTNDRSG